MLREYSQARCMLPCQNKVILHWICDHSVIQGNKQADSLPKDEFFSPFLSPELATPVSSCAVRL
jgi:hypothetical protein